MSTSPTSQLTPRTQSSRVNLPANPAEPVPYSLGQATSPVGPAGGGRGRARHCWDCRLREDGERRRRRPTTRWSTTRSGVARCRSRSRSEGIWRASRRNRSSARWRILAAIAVANRHADSVHCSQRQFGQEGRSAGGAGFGPVEGTAGQSVPVAAQVRSGEDSGEFDVDNQKTQNETNLAEAQFKVNWRNWTWNRMRTRRGGPSRSSCRTLRWRSRTARAQQMISKSDRKRSSSLYKLGLQEQGGLGGGRVGSAQSQLDLASQMAQRQQLREVHVRDGEAGPAREVRHGCAESEQVTRNNESELAQAEAAQDSAIERTRRRRNVTTATRSSWRNARSMLRRTAWWPTRSGEGRYNRGSVIEEGAFVRERQEILTLPDLSRMQVNTAVHESVLDQVARA